MDNVPEFRVERIIGSNGWRANDQVMGLGSEVDGKSFLVSDYAGNGFVR